ncbi:glycoside hydrolase family 3 N-terminal domain-containing protein [Niveispirillum sp. KHB5.9]|uniref:glycoside hydrolase family 3 N-terminal domain-containing protein n=1 Tax=Niveispirillum sp. KHB5.9 TaxID=3400269 RepID=UPI003A8C1D65
MRQPTRGLRAFLSLSVCLSLLALPAMAQEAWRDPGLDPAKRAADLVGRMTLEEKAGQMRHAAPAIPRLCIPAYNWWNEGLHGVARAGEATVFPQAVGLAATWDVGLMRQVADVTATEFRAKYLKTRGVDGASAQYRGLTVWSPNVNIFRDPRWGRGQETFGEDPYLTSRMGVAFIKGLQGDDPRHPKTVATVKHLAVHSGPNADSVDALVGNYNGTPSQPITILAGIKERFAKAEVIYVARSDHGRRGRGTVDEGAKQRPVGGG